MKAEIINVPNKTDPTIVLFAAGLKFKGQEIYLESTGNNSLDIHNKDFMHRAFRLDAIDKGIV